MWQLIKEQITLKRKGNLEVLNAPPRYFFFLENFHGKFSYESLRKKNFYVHHPLESDAPSVRRPSDSWKNQMKVGLPKKDKLKISLPRKNEDWISMKGLI